MNGDEKDIPTFDRVPEFPPSFDFELVKKIIETNFKVYEVEQDVRGMPGGEIAAFYVMSEEGEFDEKFVEVRDALRALDRDLVVVLQHRMGEDVLLVARKPPVKHKGHGLNVTLLVITALTTTLAGSFFWIGYKQIEGALMFGSVDASYIAPASLAMGFVTFAVPLMVILGIHELGHWWIARKHQVHTSLPYFIPVPPPLPFGTFGAFISMKEPIPDRKALFDIGASGPIAGFLVTIPVLVIGMVLTAVVAEPIPPEQEIRALVLGPTVPVDGQESFGQWGWMANETGYESEVIERDDDHYTVERVRINGSDPAFAAGNWTLRAVQVHVADETVLTATMEVTARHADPSNDTEVVLPLATLTQNLTVNSTGNVTNFPFTVPDNATAVEFTLEWQRPPAGVINLGDSLGFIAMTWVVEQFVDAPEDVFIHPVGLAGWVGLLVTGFNLLPAGQLDGGHVARAVLGDRMRFASYGAVFLMVALSFWFAGWLVMAILVMLLGVRHPPPLNDRTKLDKRRKGMAWAVLLLLVVCFVPIPMEVVT